jgi:hypothetical protein
MLTPRTFAIGMMYLLDRRPDHIRSTTIRSTCARKHYFDLHLVMTSRKSLGARLQDTISDLSFDLEKKGLTNW